MLRVSRIIDLKRIVVLCLGLGVLITAGVGSQQAYAAGTVELFTPYLEQAVPPGESISYSIDVINNGSSTKSVDLGFDTKGNDWSYQLTAGGKKVSRLGIKAGDTQTVNLQLEVPIKVNKGMYSFQVEAGDAVLPIAVQVTEQGTFRTELTTDQANMEGHADSTFTFSATLRNRTAEKQTYALSAQVDPGWDVTFNAGGKSVTSLGVEPNAQETISISVKPPEMVQAGTYKIPVAAANNATSADTSLEVVVTGTYGLELGTSNDLLSTEVTAGSERKVDLVITNTGSAELKDVSFTSSTPTDWEVSFEPAKLDSIAAGATSHVQATIKADNKALAGDYVVSMTASTAEKSANAQFRVAVKSSVLWGWIGILIILVVIAGIYYLFRKYGRR